MTGSELMAIDKLEAAAMPSDLLQDWGIVERPLSSPPCQLRGVTRMMGESWKTEAGIWECTPGRFRRSVPQAEVMHFLSGACTFTADTGEKLVVKGGDTLFFPARTAGVWEISNTVRKVYVLV